MQKMQAERNAVQAKSQLKLECFQKESEAQIAASITLIANAAHSQRSRAQVGRVDIDQQDKFSFQVLDLAFQFVVLF